MKRAPAVLVIALLAGCAGQPQQGLVPEQSLSHARQSAKIHTELAGEYYSRGQIGVVLEEVGEALRADPDYAPAYNVLALAYMDLREDALAQQNFEHALRLAPNDSETHNNYGWFLCQRKPSQMDQAIGHFMAALRNPLYQTSEKPYTNAGICAANRGDYKSAEEFFRKALLIEPSYPPALLGLAETHFRNADLAGAKSSLSRYMQVSAPTAESLWLGIRIERKTGDRDTEASYALQLQKRFPHSREALASRSGQFE